MATVFTSCCRDTLRVGRWWILSIVIVQFLLACFEAFNAIECHRANSECWPWFFAFVANVPYSFLIEKAFGFVPSSLVFDHFYLGTSVRFIMYFVGGSLWWFAIVAILRASYLALRHTIGPNRSGDETHV